ncbi:MAG: cytochrome c3 family protein [Desulfuromonadaceae bacterium]|nr:cytochrome c3 family protein [Desulfuromonadaceae bacterium]
MLNKLFRLIPVALLFMAIAFPAGAEQGMAIDPATCLGCHSNKISIQDFAASVHGKNGCTSCHVDITDLAKHMRKEIKVQKVQCERCHKKQSAEHYSSVHAENGITCADCHTDIHTHKPWKNDKRIAVATCIKCHDKEAVYQKSIHGKAVAAGNMDSAACEDCHNLHAIQKVGTDHKGREFHTKVCLKCHSDEKMMERNGVTTVAVKSYMESYHGKNYRLGFPDKVAGCADCHTAHSVLPKSDPKSSVNPANIVKQCAQCHKKATPLFAEYYAHGEMTDRKNFPILYYTFIAMTGLLLSTFAVFWVHTLLWMFRGFVENREKADKLASGEYCHHIIPEAHKQYRRFNRLHIFLHLLVITSFLLLSLTGLPLKFSTQTWAIALMNLYGGSANAGILHRIGAAITFVYFGSALVMSINFLFIRKDIKGNPLQRLFGPDSLCFNLRDIKDVYNMVRWFFFKGAKPTFERWTYWEKFDFVAVFWGMFAIGGSGLMLWFPEFFGMFLPGWAFNVATIVHSDEALLATGFIFSVHFFNTHGRPEKFPMDFVIFNGQIAKEEMIEERGDQWKRYEEEGITEQFACKKTSGVVYDFLVKGFGFTALFIGLSLLVLIIIAIIGGGGH